MFVGLWCAKGHITISHHTFKLMSNLPCKMLLGKNQRDHIYWYDDQQQLAAACNSSYTCAILTDWTARNSNLSTCN